MKKSANSPVPAKYKGKKVVQVPRNNNTNKWQSTKGAVEGSSRAGDKGRVQRLKPYAKPYRDHVIVTTNRAINLTIPNPQQDNLAEANEDDSEDHGANEKYEGADFSYEEGDEVINLVLQWVLLVPSQEKGKQNKIFRSLYTTNNKVCNLIIDGRNWENLISKKFVDYLKLPIDKHESLYSLS